MRVLAVIVTYNRLHLLKRVMEAVLGQTIRPDAVIVVDNSSLDGTQGWLAELSAQRPEVVPILMQSNTGGAGGFHRGILEAYERGAHWIWAMDDDCIPERDALSGLVESGIIPAQGIGLGVGFLASQVNWTDGSRHRMNIPAPSEDWTESHPNCPGSIKIRYASFVSILISRAAVETVGLPIKEFFVWRDDVEFTSRITEAGFSGYYVPNSRVTHHTCANEAMTFEHMQEGDIWKWKLGARNLIAAERHGPNGLGKAVLLLFFILKQMVTNRIPLRIQIPVFCSGINGLFFNCKRFIVFPPSAKAGFLADPELECQNKPLRHFRRLSVSRSEMEMNRTVR